ncbi:MAG TPA: ATP-binding protein [Gammaproteobacteria bacterium]
MNTSIDWQQTYAAIWRNSRQYLRPVKHIDPIRLQQLIGIENQKKRVVDNTQRFLAGKPANNALLWGSRGTGKSSLVKALLNEYKDRGLRLIQVDKDDMVLLPEIVDDIRELDYRFIFFCDDISFEPGDGSYKALKSAIEGSIEQPPENVLIYATSNRRHLLPEYMRENLDVKLVDNEIHYGDAIEEKISLSERFGLWVGFYQMDMAQYLQIVDGYFADFPGDREQLHSAARDFALVRGTHSGRTARQFYQAYSEIRRN